MYFQVQCDIYQKRPLTYPLIASIKLEGWKDTEDDCSPVYIFLISLESSSFIYRLIKSVLFSFQVFDVGIYCLFFNSVWDLSGSWYHEWFVCWLLDISSIAMRLWILLKPSVLVNFFWQHASSSEVATFLRQVRVESSLPVGLLWHSGVMGLFITAGWGENSGSWPSCTSLAGRSRSLSWIASHWHHLGMAYLLLGNSQHPNSPLAFWNYIGREIGAPVYTWSGGGLGFPLSLCWNRSEWSTGFSVVFSWRRTISV